MACLAAADPPAPAAAIDVSPLDFEARGRGTDIDDPCFWVDPGNPDAALLFLTSKGSGVVDVFDAATGAFVTVIPGFERSNNCAVEGDLLITTDIGSDDVRVHHLPDLVPIDRFAQELIQPEGVDVLTPRTGEPLIYVTDSGDASVHVYTLATRELVGSFRTGFGGGIEPIVADDLHQRIYVSRGEKESRKGIGWFTPEGVFVREFGGQVFSSDAEGMAIYACGTGGYLVVADQRGSETEFEVFDRVTLSHQGAFTLAAGSDFTNRTDGIDILQAPLPGFPNGMLAACDGCGSTVPEELDVIRWDRIATAMGLMTCPNGRPPTCGDGVLDGALEECDGLDRGACPGPCADDCTCARESAVTTTTTIGPNDSTTTTSANTPTTTTTSTQETTTSTSTTTFANTTTTTVPPPVSDVSDVRVAAGADDAEESTTGSVRLESTDLELVTDRGVVQTVGMRFDGMEIPAGAAILVAYVQFQVEGTTAEPTGLIIAGEAVDDAAVFTASARNLTSRGRTAAAVKWLPAPWATIGAAGPDQRTPDLAAIVQEIVDRPGWVSGNALVLIVTGTGSRIAESFEGAPAAAPLLHVEYTTGDGAATTPTTSPPTSTTTPSTDTTMLVTSTTTSTTPATSVPTSSTTTIPPPPPVALVVADAFTQQETPDTTFDTDALFVDSDTPKRAFLRVGVSGLAGRTVKRALLHLTVETSTKGPGDHGGRLHLTSCDWDEDSITWNRQPAIDEAVIDEHPTAVKRAEQVTFDLTGAVAGDGDVCVAITSPADDGVLYDSRETENGPRIQLILE
jgi:myo-inositol-hexaphosphate 3-phosphohydrolase